MSVFVFCQSIESGFSNTINLCLAALSYNKSTKRKQMENNSEPITDSQLSTLLPTSYHKFLHYLSSQPFLIPFPLSESTLKSSHWYFFLL
jgi:hypothetical protein